MAIPFKSHTVEDHDDNTAGNRKDLVPSTRQTDVIRALAQRVDKEAMRMVPSLAKEMAKVGWQADLDIFRATKANYVGVETLKASIDAIACNQESMQQCLAAHPELEADVVEMVYGLNDLMKQEPRLAFVANNGRYFQPGGGRRDP